MWVSERMRSSKHEEMEALTLTGIDFIADSASLASRVSAIASGVKLIVVSNREPYVDRRFQPRAVRS